MLWWHSCWWKGLEFFPNLRMGQMSCWAILQITDANFQLTRLYQRKNLRYKTSLIKVTFRWSSPDDHLKTSLPIIYRKLCCLTIRDGAEECWSWHQVYYLPKIIDRVSNPYPECRWQLYYGTYLSKSPVSIWGFKGLKNSKFLQDLTIPKKLESKTNHRVKRQSFLVFWMVS